MTTQKNQQSEKSSGSLTETLADAAGKHAVKAIGVAAAAVASAVVVRAFRGKSGSNGSDEQESIFHLKQFDDEWALMLEGETEPESTFGTKEEGLKAARELAQKSMPCELVIYRTDGTVQDRHAYQS